MSGLNVGHVGIAGEVRCVVRRRDNSIVKDTGYQKNLILDQGLDFFGGGKGNSAEGMFGYCAIGAGNSATTPTQTQLDVYIKQVSGTLSSSKSNHTPDSSNLYKTNKEYKYTFTGLNNANVSEVGLVSQGTTSADYYLCTRALIKDSGGLPTTITVLAGETLEVYYRLWRVVSTLDATYGVKMLNGSGGSTAYNVTVRAAFVGAAISVSGIARAFNPLPFINYSASDFGAATTGLTGGVQDGEITSVATYVPGSFKSVLSVGFPISKGNINIRSVLVSDSNGDRSPNLGIFKFRFGSVLDDSPIPKTNLQTLSIPLEFSWGRYEGVL